MPSHSRILGQGAGLLLAAISTSPTLAADLKTSVTDGVLHIEVGSADPATWANTQLLIDADGDAKTGYQGADADHGYDAMVEGATVYHFKGTDLKAWSWEPAGTATKTLAQGKLQLDVKLSDLKGGTASAAVLLRALSTDYKVIASAPDHGVAMVDLTTDEQNSSPPASALTATASQDGGDVVIKVTAAKPEDLSTVLVFLDADNNADTGFNPPADPRFGFDDLIQSGSLSKHTGSSRDAWSWDNMGAVQTSTTGSSETIRFNAALLKTDHLSWAVWQMSPNWQTRVEAYPTTDDGKAGTTQLALDTTKLHADATMTPPATISPVHANAALPPRERFKTAKTYCCYYGADKVAALSHLDAAILHIPSQTPETIKQLNDIGVVTIGYVSIGEDDSLRVGDGKGPGGKASWYFDSKHKDAPDQNGNWGSYFANANDPAWRADRVKEAKHLTGKGPGDYGFAGIFLDTVDTVDVYPQSHPGMVQLISELRAALPDKVIVMNRGFTVLKDDEVDRSIDGLMFEDFSDSYDFTTKTYFRFGPSDMDSTRDMMLKGVMPVMKKYGINVMALDYIQPDKTDWMQEAVDRADTFGMMCCISDIGLDAVYDTWDIHPHPNPKFLERQASPQALTITMDSPRDGFPAGTTVTPSSTFMSYNVATVVDGIANRSNLDWMKKAWASAEQPDTEQQLLVAMPVAKTAGSLKITFATDNGQPHPSRHFTVMVRADDHSDWQTVAAPTNQNALVFSCPLPTMPIQQIRIVQAPGGGSEGRPDLMWVEQVQLD